MKHLSKLVIVTLALLFQVNFSHAQEKINLAGQWSYKTDPNKLGIEQRYYLQSFDNYANLPASSDQIGIGELEECADPLNGLQRKHHYVGKIWYKKEVDIPSSWSGKQITLFMERCFWVSKVWVDDNYVGQANSLSAPHEYNLSKWLTPGKHTISVCVDNTLIFSMGRIASSTSRHTQTNWNGIIGNIELRQTDPLYIDEVRAFPDIANKRVKIEVTIANSTPSSITGEGAISIALNGQTEAITKDFKFESSMPLTVIEEEIEMGDDIALWSEFTPNLYNAHVTVSSDKYSNHSEITFGMREVGIEDNMLTINGKKVYLRGNLECCIFPLTAYPPMEIEPWERMFTIMKENGLNHARFHSWCPPAAAFAAADKLGIYMQPEAPRANIGVEIIARNVFIGEEMLRINRYYGNSPSFITTTSGNEIKAESNANEYIIHTARDHDYRHLYSKTSGGYGMEHVQDFTTTDDFKIMGGGVRGIGGPETNHDFSSRVAKSKYPVMSHEVGQWCVLPNVKDAVKYTGVLTPGNLIEIEKILTKRDLLSQVEEFVYSTGKLSALLYKEEIEILLRTKNHAGFQLLSLQDYPGQGTANVGFYDAFWDNKGFITPEEFRRFCSETVPLLRMPKRTYKSNETFTASAELFHYGEDDINGATPRWIVRNCSGKVVAQGTFPQQDIPQGVRIALGEISLPLSFVKQATKLNVEVLIDNTTAANDWDIWCYPTQLPEQESDKVHYTCDFSEALALLEAGENVLFNPSEESIQECVPGEFKSSFWSPIRPFSQTKGGYRTMGILCDPEHKALADFPTDSYSNWQWWDVMLNSKTMVINSLPSTLKPVVQVVDNYDRNYRLANIIEAKVGKGKLMVCSVDLSQKMCDKYPVIRQLRYSLHRYMDSSKFKPTSTLSTDELRELFK